MCLECRTSNVMTFTRYFEWQMTTGLCVFDEYTLCFKMYVHKCQLFISTSVSRWRQSSTSSSPSGNTRKTCRVSKTFYIMIYILLWEVYKGCRERLHQKRNFCDAKTNPRSTFIAFLKKRMLFELLRYTHDSSESSMGSILEEPCLDAVDWSIDSEHLWDTFVLSNKSMKYEKINVLKRKF